MQDQRHNSPLWLSLDTIGLGLILSVILLCIYGKFGPRELSTLSLFIGGIFCWRVIFPTNVSSKLYWISVGLITLVISIMVLFFVFK
jgi:hypothetical protein